MRREVKWFAEKMEEVLLSYDKEKGSNGWKGEDIAWILGRIKEETKELDKVLKNIQYALSLSSDRKAIIIKEAADVANFCMMLADIINEY